MSYIPPYQITDKILSLVSEIEDAFDIEVSPAELVAENFNSAESLWKMICRLKEEE